MQLGSVRDYDELVRRLLVTAAILIVYRFGSQLPLPGMAPDALSQLRGAAPEHISILALGITPYITVLIFVELLKVLFPPLRRWELAEPRHQARLGRIVLAVALLAAAAQASGLVLAMEDVHGLVASPGTPFRLSSILILVAGTALVVWFADQITRHGLGSGVWLLLIAPWITAVPYKLAAWLSWRGTPSVMLLGIVVAVAFTLLILAAVVVLLQAGGGPKALRQTSLWSVLLASSAWPWVLISLALIAGGGVAGIQRWLDPSTLLSLILLAALVALFTALYVRSWSTSGAPLRLPLSPGLLAASLAAISFSDTMVAASFPGLVPLGGHAVIATVVLLEILQRWWLPPFPARTSTHQAD